MTTIAYKDGVIAGDCMTNIGYSKARMDSKVWRDKKTDCVYGGTGMLSEMLIMRAWIEAGQPEDKKPKLPDSSNTMLVEVSPKGKVRLYDRNLIAIDIDEKVCALGSGGEYALGAMAAGKSAVQAVKIAMQYDKHTGFGVRHLKVKR